MSKPSSGHFSGTTGAKNAYNDMMSNRSASDIIAERTSGLDLREHPIKAKSKTPLKAINRKIHDRTATKNEYKKHYQASRLKDRRKDAVKTFWEDERERLAHNQPATRKWTPKQRDAILAGQRPKHDGRTIQGHHTYSVSKYPHLAGKSAIIYPATFNEHLHGWHGGNFKNSEPGRPIKIIKDF